MSIKLMAWVWENGPEKQAHRFVLIALADYANDAGECWPAVATIAAKTCLSERGVRQIIRELEAGGWLTTRIGSGRGGANVYTVNVPRPPNIGSGKPGTTFSPERPAPRIQTAETRHIAARSPERGAPEPSGTISNHQQQPRAEVPSSRSETITRERLLTAMGADPISGMIAPNGSRLGTSADMALAEHWTAMGLTTDQQCAVIAECCAAMRAKNPNWMPRRFAYFTGAMEDFKAARTALIPTGTATAGQLGREAKMYQYNKILRRAR